VPQDMTISKVLDSRQWQGQHGPMVTYRIELEDHGPAELNQKPETAAPHVGQSVFGDLEPPKDPRYPPKLRKVQQQGGFKGNGGKAMDPEQRRSIERQVSAKIAADLVIHDKAPLGEFRKLTDRIHAAIEGKG
jgi:hypothetical protein